jgi:hypothetical protein
VFASRSILIVAFMMAVQLSRGAEALAATASPESRPPIPLGPSPVAKFREWLSQSENQREKALAEYPATKREVLKVKLGEYDRLSPLQRERRLKAIELRWYLRPLLELSELSRAERVAAVPVEYRELVDQRLKEWDQIETALQKRLLQNEVALQYFTRLEQATSRPPQPPINPAQLEKLQQRLASWRATSPSQRERVYAQFNRFLELPSRERVKTLNAMPESERQEMEHTLQAFQQLPAEQRRVCVQSFQKFGYMTPEEKHAFLKNAERWEAMSPEDRNLWKQLVSNLPPMPPVRDALPPPPRVALPPPAMATNEGIISDGALPQAKN